MWDQIEKPILALAPMAGITDSAFRLIAREQGADVVYSEMANVNAIFYNSPKTLELLRFSPREQPLVVQLFGKEPKYFKKAAQIVTKGLPTIEYGGNPAPKKLAVPAGIDINLGCPARKVFNHGSGAALMPQPKLAKQIISAVVNNTHLPVSIKVRTEVKGIKLLDFLKKIKINDLNVKAVMVHGRTYAQGFTGPVDAETIKQVKQYFNGLVLANGAIKKLEDGRELLRQSQADGLGVATGSFGNLELFRQLRILKKSFTKKTIPTTKKTSTAGVTVKTKLDIARRQANYVFQLKGHRGILEMRKHLLWYFKGIKNIKSLHSQMVQVDSLEDVEKVLKEVEKLN